MRDSSTPSFSLAISTTFERISSLVIRFLLRKEYPSASKRQSPVNHEHLAGNVRSVLTYKKRHNFGNVARCSSPPERNTGKIRGYDLIVKRACHVCLHKSRRNDIDSDPPCPQLFRRRLRKSDNSCLARRVVGLPGVPSQPDYRRDQHNASGFLTHHVASSCARYVERAGEIRSQHVVPLLIRHPDQQGVSGDTCVADQDAQRTCQHDTPRNQAVGLSDVPDVCLNCFTDPTHRSDGCDNFFCRHAVLVKIDDDIGSLHSQLKSNSFTDASGSTRNQGSLSFQRHCHISSSTALTFPPGTAFRPSAVSTPFGPTSRYSLAPILWSLSIVRTHCTGLLNCATRHSLIVSGSSSDNAATLFTTGKRGRENGISCTTASNSAAPPAMMDE